MYDETAAAQTQKEKNRYCEGKTNKWTRQFCIYMVKVETERGRVL